MTDHQCRYCFYNISDNLETITCMNMGETNIDGDCEELRYIRDELGDCNADEITENILDTIKAYIARTEKFIEGLLKESDKQ